MTKKMKGSLFILFPAGVLFLSLLFPKISLEGAKIGMDLGLGSLLALFPSLVLSRLILYTIPDAFRGKKLLIYTFFLGLLTGFPVGASLLASLVQKEKITKGTAERMLFFTGSASPAFLISYCGRELFGEERIGWYFLLLQSACYLLFFFSSLKRKDLFPAKNAAFSAEAPMPFPAAVSASLKESAFSYLYLIACVTFFSFLSTLFCHLSGANTIVSALLCSFFELSTGAKKISLLRGKFALPLMGLALGWNGFSVHFQTSHRTAAEPSSYWQLPTHYLTS